MLYLRKTLVIITINFMLSVLLTACADKKLQPGTGMFEFSDPDVRSGLSIPIFFYLPQTVTDSTRILFVIHGNKRNGQTYRDQWLDEAQKQKLILIVPQFGRANGFPEDKHYNMGNILQMDSSDAVLGSVPESDWTFSYLEPLFDRVKELTGCNAQGYYLYGHSAGSQFVHRFLFFKPRARVLAAVAANAGWYTVPDFETVYPYGLQKSPATLEDMPDLLAKKVYILLGEADTSRTTKSLRRTAQAMRQGAYRLQRGKHFFRKAQSLADSLKTPFNWELHTVPAVGHSNKKMKPAAVRLLFNR